MTRLGRADRPGRARRRPHRRAHGAVRDRRRRRRASSSRPASCSPIRKAGDPAARRGDAAPRCGRELKEGLHYVVRHRYSAPLALSHRHVELLRESRVRDLDRLRVRSRCISRRSRSASSFAAASVGWIVGALTPTALQRGSASAARDPQRVDQRAPRAAARSRSRRARFPIPFLVVAGAILRLRRRSSTTSRR